MNRLSIRVLRHIKKQTSPIAKDAIVAQFGDGAIESIRYLREEGYIRSGKVICPHRTSDGRHEIYAPDGKYEITAQGLDFLQHKFGNDFDKWLNRISILLSILGGALLSKPLWSLIDRITNWLFSK